MIPASGLCTDCILLPLNQVPRQGINKQLECVVMVSWSFFTVGNTYVHLNQLGLEYLLKLLYLSSLKMTSSAAVTVQIYSRDISRG